MPTIGGEVYFEAPYEQNCLVNAMALGIARREHLVTSAAVGVGNVVLLFGASTGRDGIGGASVLASAELGSADTPWSDTPQGAAPGRRRMFPVDKRPTVQVGDPFEEKKLMECSLELLERGLLVSLQDLGAAGLTSSASEMASKGEVGIDIDVARVPLREPDMEPFEIMVSESQERMLCVVEPAQVDAVLELCAKWEVSGAPIGTVTDTGHMRIFEEGELLGSMPVRALVDDCPLYDLQPGKPTGTTYRAPKALLPPQKIPQGDTPGEGTLAGPGNELLLALLSLGEPRLRADPCSSLVRLDRPLIAHRRGAPSRPTPPPCWRFTRSVTAPRRRPRAVTSPRAIAGIAVSIDCNGRQRRRRPLYRHGRGCP